MSFIVKYEANIGIFNHTASIKVHQNNFSSFKHSNQIIKRNRTRLKKLSPRSLDKMLLKLEIFKALSKSSKFLKCSN